jgi:uncharacterized protein (DUF924 family)
MGEDIAPNAVVAFRKAAGPDIRLAKDEAPDAESGRRFRTGHLATIGRERQAE